MFEISLTQEPGDAEPLRRWLEGLTSRPVKPIGFEIQLGGDAAMPVLLQTPVPPRPPRRVSVRFKTSGGG